MKQMHYIGTIVLLFLCVISGVAFSGSDRLPKALIRLPDSEHAILVEKKTQTLYVYSAGQGRIEQVFKASCSTGEVQGPKSKAGDKKTPEGVYFLKDEYEDKYLTPVYGKKAFPSDYPNFLDLRLGKQGSAIWIHGTDKPLKPMDSNGCIALDNENVLALADYIRLDATPLIIVEELAHDTAEALSRSRTMLTSFLDKWARALAAGSYHQYLGFYDAAYLPEISWWEAWLTMRNTAADQKKGYGISLSNIGLYTQNGVVVALMDMHLNAGKDERYLGKRQLFIRTKGETPVIVGDFFQKKAKAYDGGESALIAAARDLVPDKSTDVAIVETVEQWLAAWSAKDMTEYAAFYANDFYSEGLGKTAWVRRKKRLAKRYGYISVTGKDYKVVQKKDGYVVSFLQDYRSSGFSTKGRKQLKLVKKGGVWKIYRENWKGK